MSINYYMMAYMSGRVLLCYMNHVSANMLHASASITSV
jgi:hypothetical protein